MLSKRKATGWQSAVIDDVGDSGFRTALAIDGEGFCHIAYMSECALWYSVINCEEM